MCVGDGCKPSHWHFVSSCCVLGVRYKSIKWHLVSSVGLCGSEADVSPAIGVWVPCLPVCVCFVSACVSRTTVALILVPDEIRRHKMRCPSEPSPLFLHLCCLQCVCVMFVLATFSYLFERGSRRVRRMRRGANTFPSHNRLPIPFSLVARPCLFQVYFERFLSLFWDK